MISLANSYSIYVKYRGYVDVSEFQNLDLKSSSFVKEIFFDSKSNYLIVNLKGTYYQYCRVPNSIVSKWVNSYSLGKYYLRNIKGNYDCRLGGVPQ